MAGSTLTSTDKGTRTNTAALRRTPSRAASGYRLLEDGVTLAGDTVRPAFRFVDGVQVWDRQPSGPFYVEDRLARRVVFVRRGLSNPDRWGAFYYRCEPFPSTLLEPGAHRLLGLRQWATCGEALAAMFRWARPRQGRWMRIAEGEVN